MKTETSSDLTKILKPDALNPVKWYRYRDGRKFKCLAVEAAGGRPIITQNVTDKIGYFHRKDGRYFYGSSRHDPLDIVPFDEPEPQNETLRQKHMKTETSPDLTKIQNGIITGTTLGFDDHGIMSCRLTIEMGAYCQWFGQGFGGYAFDEVTQETRQRMGCAYGMKFIVGILKTLEVNSWERLPGTHIRVERGEHGIARIGHFLKDQWFDPEEVMG